MLEVLREIVPLYILQSHKTPNHSLWVKRREFLILKLLVGLYIVTAVFETVNFIYISTSIGCHCFVHETFFFFLFFSRGSLIYLSLRFHCYGRGWVRTGTNPFPLGFSRLAFPNRAQFSKQCIL